ncbi:hypothetical protein AAF712_012014 [Marasmius tenuissimus]|uniref:Uncharacterized protein n=1 Tax=Marasmius tenuissimus TaxID=585030 RepID=A0ABR2ZJP9_9AGAR
MVPWGKRVPSGGSPGDDYTYYRGIDPDGMENMRIAFRIAYDSMAITETARVYHKGLVESMEQKGKDCGMEPLGGANLFNCTNYTAPLHFDKDAVRSLCCQLEKRGTIEEWGEYGFCYAEYGYAFETCLSTHQNHMALFYPLKKLSKKQSTHVQGYVEAQKRRNKWEELLLAMGIIKL